MAQPSITCPVCGMTSYHPEDIKQGYCGNCHKFTSEPYGKRVWTDDRTTADRAHHLPE